MVNTKRYQVSLQSMGLSSSIALGVEANFQAFICGYDSFQTGSFYEPCSPDKQILASMEEFYPDEYGHSKFKKMLLSALNEALETIDLNETQPLKIYLCLSYLRGIPTLYSDVQYRQFIHDLLDETTLSGRDFDLVLLRYDRCSFAYALELIMLAQTPENHLVLSVDSLVTPRAIQQFSGGLYGEGRRLIGEEHPNAFIPGEAASAIFLRTDIQEANDSLICGVGKATESITFDQGEELFRADGLHEASMQALQQAHLTMFDMDARIASVSGENYFFKELALAQIRLLDIKKDQQPLWHPADSIGEVGSVIGSVCTMFSALAIRDNLFSSFICMLSNDDEHRAAMVISKGN